MQKRDRFTREVIREQQLMSQIIQIVKNKDTKYTWVWLEDDEGTFLINSAYNAFNNLNTNQCIEVFKHFQSLKVLRLAQQFTWRLLLDRIPTKTNLEKKKDRDRESFMFTMPKTI